MRIKIAPCLVAAIALAGTLHADVSSDFRLHSGNLTGSGVDRLNSFAIDDGIYSGNHDYLKALLDAGYPVPSVVLHAVSRGMTVSDAAYFITRADSDLAAEIYRSVSQLLPYMPSWACGRSLSPRFERRQTYGYAELGPNASIRSVAERYFNDNQRLARTDATGRRDDPDWTKGEYHLRAAIDELIEVTGEGRNEDIQEWWYQPGSGVGQPGEIQPPIFVSLYPSGKRIVTDIPLARLEELKAGGTTEMPIVFVFNPPEYMPISRLASDQAQAAGTGTNATPAPPSKDAEISIRKVANAFFLFGNRVTPPREWHLADYHMAATAEELQEETPLPDVELLPPTLRQKIVGELEGGFGRPVQITLFGDTGDLWLDDPARVAVAISQGFREIPVVFHYHESSRFGCNLPATCLPAVKDAISEAGGNVKPRPGPGGGQPPAILPPVYPPVILPPGITPDRPFPVSPE